jgi:hypothetical protein
VYVCESFSSSRRCVTLLCEREERVVCVLSVCVVSTALGEEEGVNACIKCLFCTCACVFIRGVCVWLAPALSVGGEGRLRGGCVVTSHTHTRLIYKYIHIHIIHIHVIHTYIHTYKHIFIKQKTNKQ